jgi:hypothetical protein
MAHSAKIICDSISEAGARLTTMEIVFPRIVLAEFNTHRVFSRNSASSRAIPIEKMIRMVKEDPYIPSHWGKNQKGMQAEREVSPEERLAATNWWLRARDAAVERAEALKDIGIHKQITNRLLEPFMWHTVIVSATDWSNFFHLRCHIAAHPDIQLVARLMQHEHDNHEPTFVRVGQWHLPYIFDEDYNTAGDDIGYLVKVCSGRCARVSYLTHAGVRDLSEDVRLHDDLLTGGHMSPLEHAATPLQDPNVRSGNFRGWQQYRKLIQGEADILGYRKNVAIT